MAKTSVVHNESGCKHGTGCGNTDWTATTCKNCLKLQPIAAPQDAAPQDAAPQDIAPQDVAPQDAAPQDEMPPAVDRETLCDDPIGCDKVGTNHIERSNEPTDLLRCDEHTPPKKEGWLESNLRDPEFKKMYDEALVDQAQHFVGNARQRRKARRAAERAARTANQTEIA